jgi:signal transduction histidine kinase
MEEALSRADDVLVEGRDRVRELRGGPADTRDLHDALSTLGNLLAQQSGCTFSLETTGADRALLPAVLDEVYRIGHEAVMNAFLHADAAHIRLSLAYGRRRFGMTVSDDGRGIDPAYLGVHGREDHWGLRGMHERAQRIGATLRVDSSATDGTQITLYLPGRMAYRRPARFGLR